MSDFERRESDHVYADDIESQPLMAEEASYQAKPAPKKSGNGWVLPAALIGGGLFLILAVVLIIVLCSGDDEDARKKFPGTVRLAMPVAKFNEKANTEKFKANMAKSLGGASSITILEVRGDAAPAAGAAQAVAYAGTAANPDPAAAAAKDKAIVDFMANFADDKKATDAKKTFQTLAKDLKTFTKKLDMGAAIEGVRFMVGDAVKTEGEVGEEGKAWKDGGAAKEAVEDIKKARAEDKKAGKKVDEPADKPADVDGDKDPNWVDPSKIDGGKVDKPEPAAKKTEKFYLDVVSAKKLTEEEHKKVVAEFAKMAEVDASAVTIEKAESEVVEEAEVNVITKFVLNVPGGVADKMAKALNNKDEMVMLAGYNVMHAGKKAYVAPEEPEEEETVEEFKAFYLVVAKPEGVDFTQEEQVKQFKADVIAEVKKITKLDAEKDLKDKTWAAKQMADNEKAIVFSAQVKAEVAAKKLVKEKNADIVQLVAGKTFGAKEFFVMYSGDKKPTAGQLTLTHYEYYLAVNLAAALADDEAATLDAKADDVMKAFAKSAVIAEADIKIEAKAPKAEKKVVYLTMVLKKADFEKAMAKDFKLGSKIGGTGDGEQEFDVLFAGKAAGTEDDLTLPEPLSQAVVEGTSGVLQEQQTAVQANLDLLKAVTTKQAWNTELKKHIDDVFNYLTAKVDANWNVVLPNNTPGIETATGADRKAHLGQGDAKSLAPGQWKDHYKFDDAKDYQPFKTYVEKKVTALLAHSGESGKVIVGPLPTSQKEYDDKIYPRLADKEHAREMTLYVWGANVNNALKSGSGGGQAAAIAGKMFTGKKPIGYTVGLVTTPHEMPQALIDDTTANAGFVDDA